MQLVDKISYWSIWCSNNVKSKSEKSNRSNDAVWEKKGWNFKDKIGNQSFKICVRNIFLNRSKYEIDQNVAIWVKKYEWQIKWMTDKMLKILKMISVEISVQNVKKCANFQIDQNESIKMLKMSKLGT